MEAIRSIISEGKSIPEMIFNNFPEMSFAVGTSLRKEFWEASLGNVHLNFPLALWAKDEKFTRVLIRHHIHSPPMFSEDLTSILTNSWVLLKNFRSHAEKFIESG